MGIKQQWHTTKQQPQGSETEHAILYGLTGRITKM